MPSVGFSFLILGLVVASALGNNNSTEDATGNSEGATHILAPGLTNGTNSTSVTPVNTTSVIASTTPTPCTNQNCHSNNFTSTTSNSSSTIKPLTATTKKGESDAKSTMPSAAPRTTVTTKSTNPNGQNDKTDTTNGGSNNTGIIVLIVIILIIVAFAVVCFFSKWRARRYSVDPTYRPDEANIPLSTVDPELLIDPSSQNGLQTFESTETATIEPQELEAKPEVQTEQKTEADKSVGDPSAESAAPSPSPNTSEDKPKEVVAEQSPPAPVEPNVEEKTDDEDLVSNKTSVESLKETNENNSNNATTDLTARGLKLSDTFWDVPLDCPV